ncbi:MAG: hypothetical protein LBN25_05275, partial [Christensenellaceae bacterium]|nr:hypothetical protein [Christensenellaceae bacterium]
VSGIAKYYAAEKLVGMKVVAVINLAPVKLCGVLSQGMLLCAENTDGVVRLLTPDEAGLFGGGNLVS